MSEAHGFKGVIAPVLTPFGEDGNPDADRFLAHAKWLLADGCTGLAPFGTTGEANSLGLDERMRLLDALVGGGVDAGLLMPGTGVCALSDTVALTRHAVEAGCGGVMMLPPFYYKAIGDDGLFALLRGSDRPGSATTGCKYSCITFLPSPRSGCRLSWWAV